MKLTPQYDYEAEIVWTTDDGEAPDREWVRQVPSYRGVRAGYVSRGEIARNKYLRSPSGCTILGYSELVEDAPNLAKDDQLGKRRGRGKFCRRVFVVGEFAPDPDETDPDKLPDRAVRADSVIVGETPTYFDALATDAADGDAGPEEVTSA